MSKRAKKYQNTKKVHWQRSRSIVEVLFWSTVFVAVPEAVKLGVAVLEAVRELEAEEEAEMETVGVWDGVSEFVWKPEGGTVELAVPEGVWEAVGMRESDTKNYKRDSGAALYRRSL